MSHAHNTKVLFLKYLSSQLLSSLCGVRAEIIQNKNVKYISCKTY